MSLCLSVVLISISMMQLLCTHFTTNVYFELTSQEIDWPTILVMAMPGWRDIERSLSRAVLAVDDIDALDLCVCNIFYCLESQDTSLIRTPH